MTSHDILIRAAGRLLQHPEITKKPILMHKAMGFLELAKHIQQHGEPAFEISEAKKVCGIPTEPGEGT